MSFLSFSQNTLGGMHGHLIVPDANTFKKNSLVIGFTQYPGKHLYINRADRNGRKNNEQYYFATINFLPWLDLTLNVARIVNVESQLNGIGDRSINVKMRLLKETEKLPSIALALEVPGGNNNWFASNALIVTKTWNKLTLTGGYGLPYVLKRKITGAIGTKQYYGSIFDLKISGKLNQYLNGPLAAASYNFSFKKNWKLNPIIEFDGKKVNAGIKASWKWVNWYAYAPGLNSWSGGVSFHTMIK